MGPTTGICRIDVPLVAEGWTSSAHPGDGGIPHSATVRALTTMKPDRARQVKLAKCGPADVHQRGLL